MSAVDRHVENLNYHNDPRVMAALAPGTFESVDEATMTGVFRVGDDVYSIGVKYEVCDLCRGLGSHVNPSVDAGGLHPEDMDEDGWQAYFSGSYDVSCPECKGLRVVPVPAPRDAGEQAACKELEQWQEQARADAALDRAERLAGA